MGTSATLLVAVLMLASGIAALSLASSPHAASGASGPAATAAARTAAVPAVHPAIVTHGDLVVTAGETYYINATAGEPIYYQAGNITVESGGKLYINQVNISFVQFIGAAGTPEVRLSHIDHFRDEAGGLVVLHHATVTTDMYEINAYPKLNLTVEGTMELWNSTFAFPGWVNVEGATATLTLNGSVVTRNPTILNFAQNPILEGAENFAPTLRASDGATVNLFDSIFSHTFADNLSTNATPRPVALNAADQRYANGTANPNVTFSPGDTENLTILTTSNSSESLAQDWLYPSGIVGGVVVVYYNNTDLNNTVANVTVWYGGHAYLLGSVTLYSGTAGGRATVALSAALVDKINELGLMDYLNYTGDFGVGPAKISVELTNIINAKDHAVRSSGVYLLLDPPVNYDLVATGAGTHFNTVDSSLDLTFRPIGSSPLSLHSPDPWLANKLSLTDGANASLGNLVAPNPIPGVFESSAVTADATSHAFLYRWAQVNLTGLGGELPVYGGHITAYYAYNSVQQNNVTANRANDLETWDPAIWGYLTYWDQVHGRPAYGTSGYGGVVSLLLVSNEITGPSLPDGIFMGGYHFTVAVPPPTDASHTFNGSVSPYPVGVALNTPGYGVPDFAHPQNFPQYFAGVDVKTVVTTVNGAVVTNATVRIGETLGLEVTLTDTGTAAIFSIDPSLYYHSNGTELLNSSTYSVTLTTPGQTFAYTIAWKVNETATGLAGGSIANTFDLASRWNDGSLALGGGTLPDLLTFTISPSLVKVLGFTIDQDGVALAANGPTGTTQIDLSDVYASNGTVRFASVADASIVLDAVPINGGTTEILGGEDTAPGHFAFDWASPLSDRLTAGTTYDFVVHASFNGYTFTETLPGHYAVPAPPAPHHNFLTEKILGLPIWVWLAIAGAVVVAIVLFFVVARRQAAGKVVECGECGNLVPESATSCPKCGAEFESDLVRCSRCASTIPANSQFCPECAAQLLGKPGEGGRDPERDGYADFTERFRAEAKKELGENYTEGSFWDWWKRQPTYTSFSQWKLQQQQGAPRSGMMAPPAQTASQPAAPPPRTPPKGGAPPAASASPGDRAPPARRPAADSPPPAAPSAPPAAAPATTAGAASGLKPCPNCRKEIPPEYLVCPFCGSVTQ